MCFQILRKKEHKCPDCEKYENKKSLLMILKGYCQKKEGSSEDGKPLEEMLDQVIL